MASETELERLVVRLIGDASKYQEMVKQAENSESTFTRLDAKIHNVEASLRLQAATIGMSSQKMQEYQLRSEGASEAQLRLVRSAQAALTAAQEEQALRARGLSLAQSVMTNQERLTLATADYQSMLQRGVISQETYNRALQQAHVQYGTNSISLFAMGMGLQQLGTAMRGVTGGLAMEGLGKAMDFEQTNIAFKAMLGSASDAKKLLGDLTVFAAKTPFEMPTLLNATKMLLQFKVPLKDVMGILRSIGDVTGGADPNKVHMMAYAYSQMSAAGRLMGGDLMQMINAGFNPLSEISVKTGKSLAYLRGEMEKGKITSDMVKEAFAAASKRLNLMEEQSESLGGVWSTFKDDIGIVKREIGESLVSAAQSGLGAMLRFTGSMRESPASVKIIIGSMAGAIEAASELSSRLGSVVMAIASFKMAGGIATFQQIASGIAACSARMLALVGVTNLASLGMVSLKATAVGLALYAVYKVSTAVYDLVAGTKELNYELAKTDMLQRKIDKVAFRRSAGFQSKIQKSQGITDHGVKKEFLGNELESAKRAVSSYDAMVTWTTKNVEASAPTWKSLWQGGRAIWQQNQRELVELMKLQAESKTRLEAFQEAYDKLGEKSTVVGEKIIRTMKQEYDAIGLTTSQLEAYKAANEGATEAEQKLIEVESQRIEGRKLIASLEEEILLMGLSAAQVEKYKISLKGLAPIAQAAAEALIDIKYAKKPRVDLNKSIEDSIKSLAEETAVLKAGSKEQWLLNQSKERGLDIEQWWRLASAVSAKEKENRRVKDEAKAQEEKTRALDEGKKIMDSYMTSQQKLAAQESRLQELLAAKAITQAIFNKEIDKLRNKSVSVRFDVKGIDAVTAGSAEAMWRIAEFESGRGKAKAISRGAKPGLGNFLTADPMMIARNPKLRQQFNAIQSRLTPQASRARMQWAQAKSLRDNNPNFQAMTPVGDAGGNDVDETTLVLKEIRDLNKKMLDKDPLEGIELSNASSGGGL
jgi:tape measure domain-containing protein